MVVLWLINFTHHVTDTQRDEIIYCFPHRLIFVWWPEPPSLSHAENLGYLPITYCHPPYFKQRTFTSAANLKYLRNITCASFRIFLFRVYYLAADM